MKKNFLGLFFSGALMISLVIPAMAAEIEMVEVDSETVLEEILKTGDSEIQTVIGEEDNVSSYNDDEVVGASIVANGSCGEKLTWTIDSEGTLIISGTGEMTPTDMGDYNNGPWYSYRDQVKKVIIKDGVTSLGAKAFYSFGNLTKVIIPASVTKVGTALDGNGKKITGWTVFSGCYNLKTVGAMGSGADIEFGWTDTIPDHAFYASDITKVTIPDGMKRIGFSAFNSCEKLSKVIIPSSVVDMGTVYDEVGGIGYGMIFYGCSNLKTLGKIGSGCDIEVGWTKEIPMGAFEFSSLTSVSIPQGVTDIKKCAFWFSNSLEEVVLPDSITKIEWSAFSNCKNLAKITIPYSVKEIQEGAFDDSKIEIYGYDNSEAHRYATKYKTKYKSLGKIDPIPAPDPTPNPDKTPAPNPSGEIVTKKFTDVTTGKWYVNAVQYAVDNGIMSGTTDTTFEPDKPCTRAMMVTILYSSMGKPAVSGTTPFTDLKANWYKTPVLWAYQNNVTKGQTDTTFAPDKNVARQEMAVFLNSFAKHRGNDTSAKTDLNKFVDINQLSSWAAPQMQWANANGIINGKGGGKLDPKGNATRAEVAAMIMSFQNKFGK